MRKKLLLLVILVTCCNVVTWAVSPQNNKVKYPNNGYRGSLDVTYAANSGILDKNLIIQFSTTQGYQIMPQLYVGLGVMADFASVTIGINQEHGWKNTEYGEFTTFASVRYDALKKTITPYVEGRIGYRCATLYNEDDCDYDKLYAVPMIGVRFGNFNIAASWEWVTIGGKVTGNSNNRYYLTNRYSMLGIHLGFDWGARKKNNN